MSAPRMESIVRTRGTWRLVVSDDRPIVPGRDYAEDLSVVVTHGGTEVQRFTYPSYRIWTLLAHWTDDLPDEPSPSGPDPTETHADLGDPDPLVTFADAWGESARGGAS